LIFFSEDLLYFFFLLDYLQSLSTEKDAAIVSTTLIYFDYK